MNNRIIYLNGQYLPADQAAVSVDDRGFLFADGVYDVVQFIDNHPIAMDMHLQRIVRSLNLIRIAAPPQSIDFDTISRQLLLHNNLTDAIVYWQVTRGAAPRVHHFPNPPVAPTVYASASAHKSFLASPAIPTFKALTVSDTRWTRCEIKSIALLPNTLAKQEALDAGCDEAIFVRDNIVTEAPSRTVMIVKQGSLLTHPLDGRILPSVTRHIVLDLARQAGIPIREEYYTRDDLYAADEAFFLSTTASLIAITHVDSKPIAAAQPGPITKKLDGLYRKFVMDQCAK